MSWRAPSACASPSWSSSHFDPASAAHEPHQEVQDLLRRERRAQPRAWTILPGAQDFTPEVAADLPRRPAGGGTDRLAGRPHGQRGPHGPQLEPDGLAHPRRPAPPRLWLIDHGAALVFHHRWDALRARRRRTTSAITRSAPTGPTRGPPTRSWRPGSPRSCCAGSPPQVPDAWLADEPGFRRPDDGPRGIRRLSARPRADLRRLAAHGLPDPRAARRRGGRAGGTDEDAPTGSSASPTCTANRPRNRTGRCARGLTAQRGCPAGRDRVLHAVPLAAPGRLAGPGTPDDFRDGAHRAVPEARQGRRLRRPGRATRWCGTAGSRASPSRRPSSGRPRPSGPG